MFLQARKRSRKKRKSPWRRRLHSHRVRRRKVGGCIMLIG
jgi:hypothetical protein